MFKNYNKIIQSCFVWFINYAHEGTGSIHYIIMKINHHFKNIKLTIKVFIFELKQLQLDVIASIQNTKYKSVIKC